MSYRESTSRTIRCSPVAFTPTSTPRFPVWAGRTFTRFRSMRRSRRCTTISATACTGRPSIADAWRTSRTRSPAAAHSRRARRDSCHLPSKMEPEASKLRGKPERFAEHYAQARLFLNSQTPTERAHIVNAFRFELSRVQTPAIRERMVSGLMNVDPDLPKASPPASAFASCPHRCPKCSRPTSPRKSTTSPALSLMARPGDGSIARAAGRAARGGWRRGRRRSARWPTQLLAAGAVPRFVGARLGPVDADER